MANKRNRRTSREVAPPTAFEQARDEMFQHIIRCGVLQAAPEHQLEWFGDTVGYLRDRYPELSDPEIAELRTLGVRFCQPPKSALASDTVESTASAA